MGLRRPQTAGPVTHGVRFTFALAPCTPLIVWHHSRLGHADVYVAAAVVAAAELGLVAFRLCVA